MMTKTTGNYWGLWLGGACLLITILVPPPTPELSTTAWLTTGLAIMMAVWWVTETVPVAVTALVPLTAAPLLNILPIKAVASLYTHPLIFLFLGGFLLSLAMEKCNLHRRIALATMTVVGANPRMQVGGLMLVTAFLSMWMSNTATAVMMLPIALSVIELLKVDHDVSELSPALLLGIAYSASIGGVATLIGTPPNALLAAYLSDTYQIEIGFGQWMLFALPMCCLMLLAAWYWLTRSGLEGSGSAQTHALFQQQLQQLGPLHRHEKRVLIIFVGAATGWILRVPLAQWTGLPISDTTIAMVAATLLFIIPSSKKTANGQAERLLDWPTTQKLPWGVLLLFGGGLALAGMIKSSGLAQFIGASIGQAGSGQLWLLILVVTAAIVFLTEVTSNTATTAGFLPLLGPVAVSLGYAPQSIVIPAALAASCAFMMPVATPPNAIVFASGELRIKQMALKGLMLNFVATALITAASVWLLPLLFN
ncbi:DASS family sodium-coupled anion symporter [Neiella sp. HB171785]|uniref:DASS family sodium-coupled anion symporter n=1 Tax=Neiella litorisoli TaxID=2771431 RepID=A0A8J6UK46_9GAMM|nr:DASS family sodium-coupled anion symporter [Neiella litorisoli]MBD1391353.1 DASS family sodium-coupled anion symporter [Neiella litorisoli]